MKENLNTLAELGKEIDLSMFYDISFDKYQVRLQGHTKDINFDNLSAVGFEKYGESDVLRPEYDVMHKDNVVIVATL